jgi:hypothetical protein
LPVLDGCLLKTSLFFRNLQAARSAREKSPAAGEDKRGKPVLNTGAYEHLATALEMLTQRSRQIEEELARVETLQAEQDMIRKQIEAINAAMPVFRP